ncbi:MAG: WD40/YVTN/BNR-like repeat-containing protein [Gemmatimonadota bacterium]
MRTSILMIAVWALASHAAAQQPVATEQVSGTDALLIAVSAVDEHVVWVSGARGTWLRTTDGGATWQAGRVPGADSLQFRDVHAIDSTTAYLLSIGEGSRSRIYRTTDAGRTWTLQFTNPEPGAPAPRRGPCRARRRGQLRGERHLPDHA